MRVGLPCPTLPMAQAATGSSLPSIFTPAEKAKQAANQSLQEKRSGCLDPKTATSILESHGFAGHTPPAYALTSKTNLIAWINRQKAAQTAAQRQAAQRQASKAAVAPSRTSTAPTAAPVYRPASGISGFRQGF